MATVLATPPAAAQWPPDSLQNLQVLPETTSVSEIVGIMRGFASGLGVRCIHCHMGDDPNDLSTTNFVSDEKETKKKARVMIQMRDAINSQHLTQLGKQNALEVNCVTCHHGQEEPKTIEYVMNETIEKEGIDSATQKYHELREKHYGGFAYNFQARPLERVSESLARSGKVDEAIALLKLNLEFHPESFMSHYSLGEALGMKGDKEAAVKSLEKAYEIMPNPRIKKKIEELSKK